MLRVVTGFENHCWKSQLLVINFMIEQLCNDWKLLDGIY